MGIIFFRTSVDIFFHAHDRRHPSLAPQTLQCAVYDDPSHPTFKRSFVLELIQVREDPDETLLQDLLCFYS